MNTSCGSPCYASPEMVSGKKYLAEPVDVWTLGVVFYFMIVGNLPFEDANNSTNEIYNKIIHNKYQKPENISDSALNLIENILVLEISQRFTLN